MGHHRAEQEKAGHEDWEYFGGGLDGGHGDHASGLAGFLAAGYDYCLMNIACA
ncbi:hypothetical protein [Celeribacter halophilus]|uniref:hypothetical protein n=1 Tax=Celeribacter halophilus TaxID=576117 RepID=UPI003A937BFA